MRAYDEEPWYSVLGPPPLSLPFPPIDTSVIVTLPPDDTSGLAEHLHASSPSYECRPEHAKASLGELRKLPDRGCFPSSSTTPRGRPRDADFGPVGTILGISSCPTPRSGVGSSLPNRGFRGCLLAQGSPVSAVGFCCLEMEMGSVRSDESATIRANALNTRRWLFLQ